MGNSKEEGEYLDGGKGDVLILGVMTMELWEAFVYLKDRSIKGA